MTEGRAVISDCGRYRYLLTRTWGNPDRSVVFVMLNPSTADAEQDDPTIRRCIGFAKAWGYGALEVVNLFAYRSTDPDALRKLDYREAIGPENKPHIERACRDAQRVIAAWGAHPIVTGRSAIAHLNIHALVPFGIVDCLGLTKGGAPRHPLYVPANTTPISFAAVSDD